MPGHVVTYRRAALYEEVWSDPVQIVAGRYGVSGVALAKICRKLNIPLPGRGYWARKRAGQKMKKAPLPSASKDMKEVITVTRWTPSETARPELTAETEATVEEERAAKVPIVVP